MIDTKEFFLNMRERVFTFGTYAKSIQSIVHRDQKGDETDPAVSIVTDSDMIVENGLLNAMINKGYHLKSQIGTEEGSPYSSKFLINSEFRIEIDPIDGTLSYGNKLPWWCIVLSTYKQGKLDGVMVHTPYDQRFYCATQDLPNSWIWTKDGETYNQSSLQFKDSPADKKSLLTHQMPQDIVDKITNAGITIYPVEKPCLNGYPHVGLNSLFRGDISGWLKKKAPARDWGSMSLIVEKAGGIVTDYSGKMENIHQYFCRNDGQLDGFLPSIIVTRDKDLHRQLLDILNE